MAPHAAQQPNVDDLLKAHAKEVSELRAALGTAAPGYTDDIWALRFVLSFPDVPKRVAAARHCIEWRAANASLLADAAAGVPPPLDDVIGQHCVAGYHKSRTLAGEPVFIVRAGLCNPAGLMKIVTPAQFLTWLMYQKELAFRICDAETRERRVLVKMLSVVDLSGVTLAMGAETQYQKTIGESGKLSEEVYPQLLARSIVMHPPFFFWALFSVFKVFMSAKMLEKMGVCPGRSASSPLASACPFASARFALDALPTFLGGNCRCTAAGGCVAATPNDRRAAQADADADGSSNVTVPAGGAHEVVLTARTPGDRLAWTFSLADKGVEFSATVEPEAGPAVQLVPPKKYKKEDGDVAGSAVVPVAGTVKVKFDNAHSRFTSKSLRVSVIIVPASAEAKGGDK